MKTRDVGDHDARPEDLDRRRAVWPLVGAILLAGLWPAALAGQEVQYLTVTSRNGENVLEWVNPVGSTTVRINYTTGAPCVYPAFDSGIRIADDQVGLDGGRDRFAHGGLADDTTHCYGVFVKTGAITYSAGRTISGRPMVSTSAVKWSFNVGVTGLAAPTVGTAGIIAVSNANVLHAMRRGDVAPAGEWPASWLPKPLGSPVQSRSPVIPIDVGGTNPVIYLATDAGEIHAVDGVLGGPAINDPWPPVALGGSPGHAAPAGMFTAFGGSYDYLLVGTFETGVNNRFYAIDPITGAAIDSYDGVADTGKGFGPVTGMAAVDYANDRVYFTSARGPSGGNKTVWCLVLEPQPAPVFRECNPGSSGWPRAFNDIYASPVFAYAPTMSPFVYTGGDSELIAIEATSGATSDTWSIIPQDGYVKLFVWPDRSHPGDVYFATDSCIYAFHHTGTTWSPGAKFGGCISLPGGAIPTSGVLVRDQRVYVGGDNGQLHEVDLSGASPRFNSVQLGDGSAFAVGSPALDWPNSLIHVGSEPGVFYAVQIPLP